MSAIILYSIPQVPGQDSSVRLTDVTPRSTLHSQVNGYFITQSRLVLYFLLRDPLSSFLSSQ